MLKVDLKLMGNVIVGQVLEQDESLRGKGKIISNDDINIYSEGMPELDECNLFIRGGAESNDNNYFCFSYNNAEEAKGYYDAFLKAIEEINKKDDELWLPKYGEEYYRIMTTGEVLRDDIVDDEGMFSANNVFKSKEIANKVAKSTKLHWLLWRLKERYCPDCEFILHENNYTLLYSREEKRWDCYLGNTWDHTTPCFDKESANKAAKYLNSHPELWEDLI